MLIFNRDTSRAWWDHGCDQGVLLYEVDWRGGSGVNGGIYVSYKKLSIISYPSIRLRALHVIRFVYVVVVGVIFGFSFVFM